MTHPEPSHHPAVEAKPLVDVKNLHVSFADRSRRWVGRSARVGAVRGVDLSSEPGTCLGLVGESGSGKSTFALATLRLIPIDQGKILFDGCDVFGQSAADLKNTRQRMQMVFQQAATSMNPRMTVESIVGDPLRFVNRLSTDAKQRRVFDSLQNVGFDESLRSRFPHELSGGQLQRVAIARALVLAPDFLVCDEPVSALDVSAQVEVLEHLASVRRERSLTVLFITHDLDVAATLCDELAVMYLGRIVERGSIRDVIGDPQHPYTFFLNSARATFDHHPERSVPVLGGEPPSPVHPPEGCAFHPRCPLATNVCRTEAPALKSTGQNSSDHSAACHHSHRIVELKEFTGVS